MKKFLTLILALVIALSLVACGSNKAEDTMGNLEENISTEKPAEEPSAENEDEENNDETSDEVKEEEKKPSVEKEPEEGKKPVEEKPAEDKKPVEEKPAEDKKPVEEKPAESKTLGNKLLSEFKSIASSGNALAVAEKLSANSELSVLSVGAMTVEPGFLAGFDNTEITGFSEGATFAPMIGTIPFVGYVFTLEDGVNANDFIAKLKSGANLRWNICSEAEEMVAGSSGNKVFFVMCNKSLDE